MASRKEDIHVLVVGAGLAGLATAHGLKKNGISYTLLDRESQPRDRNWGVTISWSHPFMEQLLPAELYASLQECQPDRSLNNKAANKETILVRHGATGETMLETHFPGVRRMNIQKTKKVWAKGLNIKYGKKLSGIDILPEKDGGGVVARFEDGTTETGDVIMGADGGASYVRRWLLGDAAEQEVLPYTFMNFPFTLTAEQARWLDGVMNPNVDVAAHPQNMYLGLFLLDKPDLEKPETWIFYLLVTWPVEAEDEINNNNTTTTTTTDHDESSISRNLLARLRAHMHGWADPFKSVVSWLPDSTPIKPDKLRIWHPKPWENHGGRVTLSGDAAHSMTFHRGQGGNLAIKDALEFVNTMVAVRDGEIGLKEGMDEYDAGAVARGEEVEISKKQADAFNHFDTLTKSPVFKMGIKPNQVE